VRGGATSHVAILARSLGIPALAGIEARAMELPNGTPVILDGSKGTLRLNPSLKEIAQLREAQVRNKRDERRISPMRSSRPRPPMGGKLRSPVISGASKTPHK